jgi:hypothetical protein
MDSPNERQSPGNSQTDEHQSVVRSRRKLPDIGKIEILRDQESPLALGGFPDIRITPSSQAFLPNVIHVMVQFRKSTQQRLGQIFVQFDLHARDGSGGIGKSSSAEAAA